MSVLKTLQTEISTDQQSEAKMQIIVRSGRRTRSGGHTKLSFTHEDVGRKVLLDITKNHIEKDLVSRNVLIESIDLKKSVIHVSV